MGWGYIQEMDIICQMSKISELCMKPYISVVIPAHNASTKIHNLLESLKTQDFYDYEIIVIDDNSSDPTSEIAKEYAKVVKLKNKKGPAGARNVGIREANGQIIAFTDSDCVAKKDWLKNIAKAFDDQNIHAVQGHVKIPKSNFLGDSISALGFPAGGSVGFENMWHVSKEGFTDHITTCNCAVRKDLFLKIGFFDETFKTPGGEDSEFSYRLSKQGFKIKYLPNAIVIHEPRESFSSFVKWQLTRGRSNYYFKKKVGYVGDFVKLRFWSTKNIIKKFHRDPKFPLILVLLFLSFILQQIGYIEEYIKDKY
jgi:glycosyltransferase involved in cell wall biosynthesis